jgi:hypothetical protein
VNVGWDRLLGGTTCHQHVERLFRACVFRQANKPNLFDPCAPASTIGDSLKDDAPSNATA